MDVQAELKSFNRRLEILVGSLELIKKYGIGEDILLCYLCHNLKISEKKAQSIMNYYEDFYKQIVNGMVIKSIEQTNKEIKGK